MVAWCLTVFSPLIDYNKTPGAAVNIKMTCNKGHQETWSNSKTVGKGKKSMPIINLLLIVYTFLSGLHFNQLQVSDQLKLLLEQY